MPRRPGGPAQNLPVCSREGHDGHRVVLDGVYGNPPRQRFRCVGEFIEPATGKVRKFHRFVPELPRHNVQQGQCDTCDNKVAVHQGPVVSRRYDFPLREVAAALVAVGAGSSYLRAGQRARAAAGRRVVPGDGGGAVVAEWLDALAPIVLNAHAEQAWPETLVLDSTRFMVENVRTGTQALAFNVLGAYGYPEGGDKPRVWALRAYHRATTTEWADFLTQLDTSTRPRLVITDGAPGIGHAVRQVWPAEVGPSFPTPFVKRCEHHLHANGVEAMAGDNIGGWAHWLRRRLDTAFRRDEGWDELQARAVGFASTSTWLAGIRDAVTVQVGVRHLLPAHHSTAALDTHLGTIRGFLDSRSFVLRNATRTNLLLGLMRLHLNGVDVERRYRQLLRDHLSDSGRPVVQRNGYDPPPPPGITVRGSLRR